MKWPPTRLVGGQNLRGEAVNALKELLDLFLQCFDTRHDCSGDCHDVELLYFGVFVTKPSTELFRRESSAHEHSSQFVVIRVYPTFSVRFCEDTKLSRVSDIRVCREHRLQWIDGVEGGEDNISASSLFREKTGHYFFRSGASSFYAWVKRHGLRATTHGVFSFLTRV